MTPIHDAVRAWAKGIYPSEAGVELLIRQGKAIYEGAPWLVEERRYDSERVRMVSVDVDKLVYESGAWSGGERRVVDIAASLLSREHPVDLSDAISGLDRAHQDLVLAAISHAAGSHQGTEVTVDERGRPGFHRGEALHPWPTASTLTSPGVPPGATPPGTGYGPGL